MNTKLYRVVEKRNGTEICRFSTRSLVRALAVKSKYYPAAYVCC